MKSSPEIAMTGLRGSGVKVHPISPILHNFYEYSHGRGAKILMYGLGRVPAFAGYLTRHLMIRKVVGIYFSPIGGTANMTEQLVRDLVTRLDGCSPLDITSECYDLLRMNGEELSFDDETIAVVGMPVYVGKIPLPGAKAFSRIHGGGAMTIAAVSYGGRSYGNALYELQHFVEKQDFKVIGAGAFSVHYRHRGLRNYAEAGENVPDMDSLAQFGAAAAAKIRRLAGCDIEGLRVKPAPLEVNGRLPKHRVSRVSPRAAAAAQQLLEKLARTHRASEWYL